MAENEQQKEDTKLRQIFRTMNAYQAQEIREAYYKAIEGLHTLAEALEIADAMQTQSAGPLLEEHLYTIEAIDAMRKSQLGKVL